MKSITLDLKKERQTIEITQNAKVNSIYIGRGDSNQKVDLTITHKHPDIKSEINIKAVVFDSAKFDLEALLKIEKGAKNTDTFLKIDCLVVGEKASARAVPSLEINEDEVKGGHGATIGYLDPEMISYLQSKGLRKTNAEKLLIDAFIEQS